MPCWNEHINNFLYQLNRPIFYNKRILQSAKSIHCGFFTILFAILYDVTRKHIQLIFSPTLEKNDKLCVEYIKLFVKFNFVTLLK